MVIGGRILAERRPKVKIVDTITGPKYKGANDTGYKGLHDFCDSSLQLWQAQKSIVALLVCGWSPL
jgi:hypothetical protein